MQTNSHLQLSLVLVLPLAGVLTELLGSDSHVTAPLLSFRIYLYSIDVLAGKVTVTEKEEEKAD